MLDMIFLLARSSPILVTIYDCTEHMRLRAVLSNLAESQLEMTASIMPLHAIQVSGLCPHLCMCFVPLVLFVHSSLSVVVQA